MSDDALQTSLFTTPEPDDTPRDAAPARSIDVSVGGGVAPFSPHPRLLESLRAATEAHPLERKLLVCARPAEGRELLRALSASGTPWIGWEVATLRQLTHELAALDLAREGVQLADEFEVQALLDEAIDQVVERGSAGPLGRPGGAVGVREAIRSAVTSLRAAGIDAGLVAQTRPGDAKLDALAEMLRAYEALLRERRRADPAEVVRRALAALQAGAPVFADGRIFLLPGHTRRGPAGRVVEAILAFPSAELLETDSVLGAEAPESVVWAAPAEGTGPLSALHAPESAAARPAPELFAAATPLDELREVLRRVVRDQIPWDRVEVVATDPVTYGAALDALARRLEIPVTFAGGLDIRRTRVGRALGAYLRWIADGFPADVLRALLETGDLEAPGADGVSGAALARRLRRLRIGWGRDRYLPALEEALAALDAQEPGPEEERDPGSVEREREELRALLALLRPILAATPALGARTRAESVRTSPAALATGALAFLERVPAAEGSVAQARAEQTLRKVYRQRLERIAATLDRPVVWEAALATLRARLETRVAARGEEGLAPWTSASGHLHLSDLSTAGLACRPHVFVVGLDAGRLGGGGGADPLLTDADRFLLNRLAGGAVPPLPGGAERALELRHAAAAALARLRGSITLSYSAWDAAEGRATSPAPELLQALRLREGDVALAYQQLYDELGPLACAVPRDGACLDEGDVWLASLAHGGVLREGTDVVRAAFAELDRGLRALERRGAPDLTEFDGIVEPRPGLDPRGPEGDVFSASRLETLGACPRRYFYRYVLRVSPPDDPEWDPERWLDAAARGTLLHAVYEHSLRRARTRGVALDDERFVEIALEVLAEEAARTAKRLPPPSETVRRLELEDLERDVLAFAGMLRSDPPAWRQTELRFGPDAREVTIGTAGGPVRVRGAIDRVDEVAPGRLRIVDYKTGRPTRYRRQRPFDGGRRVQHLVYMQAAEQILGAEVEAMEYHFPTRRGETARVEYTRTDLAHGATVLDELFAMISAGHFLATDDPKDCRYCDFADACRVRTDDYNNSSSPPAQWAKEHAAGLPEYERLLKLRKIDG